MKTVMITGVSSGTGLALTKEFINAGYRVIGSVRNSVKAAELEKMFGTMFSPLVFDITNHWEIDIAVNRLRELLSDSHLDGLINNAGSAEIGPLLHVSMNDFRKQLEVLVIAQLNIIQKFFKFLLPQNPSIQAGRNINVSSVSGQSSNYFFGCYSAAKHALEGLSKTLREELNMYGVKVVVVAPGNIQTSLWGKQTLDIVEKYKETVYYPSLKNRVEHIHPSVSEDAMSTKEFSKVFLEIFSKDDPAERYTVYKKKNTV
jgi:NAD(P)-dependent dehydrogenase (short-subunit alcohol dehydrogenase family)